MDNGQLGINFNPQTGAVTVTIRQPLSIVPTSLTVDPLTFIDLSAQVTSAFAQRMAAATLQMQALGGTPA